MEDILGKGTWSWKCHEFERKWCFGVMRNCESACVLVDEIRTIGWGKHAN